MVPGGRDRMPGSTGEWLGRFVTMRRVSAFGLA
jgi:hypothetical protein